MTRTLYTYWRSSASYRVRIALALKGLTYEQVPINLAKGAQTGVGFKLLNPQGFVPYLIDDTAGLNQSLAIIEYLDEVYPDPPLLPGDALARARVRGAALQIACDIHPLNNLRVLNYLAGRWGRGRRRSIRGTATGSRRASPRSRRSPRARRGRICSVMR